MACGALGHGLSIVCMLTTFLSFMMEVIRLILRMVSAFVPLTMN